MEYVVMSLEEAKKVAKKNATVLVAKQDLEKDDCNESFSVKKFCDCKNILEEAATIAKVCDNFASQLRVFSDIQEDVINYEKKGVLNVILFQSRCNDLEWVLTNTNICSIIVRINNERNRRGIKIESSDSIGVGAPFYLTLIYIVAVRLIELLDYYST